MTQYKKVRPLIITYPGKDMFDVVTPWNADLVSWYKTFSYKNSDGIVMRVWDAPTKRWSFHNSFLPLVTEKVRLYFPKLQVVEQPDTKMSTLMEQQTDLVADVLAEARAKIKREHKPNIEDIKI